MLKRQMLSLAWSHTTNLGLAWISVKQHGGSSTIAWRRRARKRWGSRKTCGGCRFLQAKTADGTASRTRATRKNVATDTKWLAWSWDLRAHKLVSASPPEQGLSCFTRAGSSITVAAISAPAGRRTGFVRRIDHAADMLLRIQHAGDEAFAFCPSHDDYRRESNPSTAMIMKNTSCSDSKTKMIPWHMLVGENRWYVSQWLIMLPVMVLFWFLFFYYMIDQYQEDLNQ